MASWEGAEVERGREEGTLGLKIRESLPGLGTNQSACFQVNNA